MSCTFAPFFDDAYIRHLFAGKRPSRWRVLLDYIHRFTWIMKAGRFDLVWVEYELFPWMPAWAEVWLASRRVPLVVGFDDAVYHRYDMNVNKLVRSLLGRKIDRVMRAASLVQAGNASIAGRAEKAGAERVEIIPTPVDTARFQPAAEKQPAELHIGWIGTPVTAAHLAILQSALERVLKPGRVLVMIGARPPASLARLPVEELPWTLEMEVGQLQSLDIGIMPLPDQPFERGKCGYKLLQYMACGLPVVASPVGVNLQIVDHGVNGFLATTDDEWVDALELLASEPGLRVEMGKRGREKVEKQYSRDMVAGKVIAGFRQLLDG
jgi:hypothetical protein